MFNDFLKNGKVRKGQPDIALAKSLIAMSTRTLRYAQESNLTEENASPVLVNYYESLRQICEAICAKNGYKVYSHEAFTVYLNEILREERTAENFDRLRKLRNGVNYYGESVSLSETQASAKKVVELIAHLQKYLEEL
ncbi:MAG TPA: hypothetical protein VJJ82_05755 [Candidatus Nanoarchaeia archaeon]|nr:hypothetical protein [Candidatus Nanoarchaeia archaeon]